MSETNRKTLKNYFKSGRKPSQQAFEDLIDSNLNMIDEGIRKTPTDGLKLSQLDQGKLISFDKKDALTGGWSVRMNEQNDLILQGQPAMPAITVSSKGKISINKDDVVIYPDGKGGITEVKVNGCITSSHRKGCFAGVQGAKQSVPADGQWHDLIEDLTGCNSFEIVAGVKNELNQKYALLHARAMNAANPESIFNKYFSISKVFIDLFRSKKRIVCHHAFYNLKCDKLRLRWVTPDPNRRDKYSLQIKTSCCYGDGTMIHYHITQLWGNDLFKQTP